MSHSSNSFQGQGSAPRSRTRWGCVPSQPRQCRQEKRGGRGSQLSAPLPSSHPSCKNPGNSPISSCFWTKTLPRAMLLAALQEGEDGDGNADSLHKVSLNPHPQKGPNLGFNIYICLWWSHSAHAWESSTGQQNPAEQESQQCWLCCVLLFAPKGSGLHLNRKLGSDRSRVLGCQSWLLGTREEVVLLEELLLLMTLPIPSVGSYGGISGHCPPSGPSLSGRVLPHFFAGPLF